MQMQFPRLFLIVALSIYQSLLNAPIAGESTVPKAGTDLPANVPLKLLTTQASAPRAELQLDRRSPQYKQAWWRSTADEYRRCGKTNAAWDALVFSAIEIHSELILHEDVDDVASELMQRISEKVDKAVQLGCDDALIKYYKLRYGMGRDKDKYFSELVWGYLACAEALDKTDYHPALKIYANFHACNFTKNLSPPEPRFAGRAKALLRYAHQALQDPKIPVHDASKAAECAVWIGVETEERKELETAVFPTLEKNWRDYAFAYVAQGRYFNELAWKSRGHSYADGVTKEGWKGFEENIAKADVLLRKGWEVDKSNVKLPIEMISV